MYIGFAADAKRKNGALNNRADLAEAVIAGCRERLRPVVMTKVAIIGGLLPIMYGTGAGSEVMKRIATPMVGGMLSTVVASFIVIPAIYVLLKQGEFKE
jgi:Cu(I)/Ag(I) efflux system membrane protein CusA/SilA